MIHPQKKLFRWGPIPGRLISVAHWVTIYYWHPGRLHRYIWPESYTIFYKGKILFITETKKLDMMGGEVFQEIILTSKIKTFWQVWQKHLFCLFSFCKKINSNYLKILSNSELKKKWKEFSDLIYLFWEIGIIPELGAYGGESILKNAIEKEKLDEDKKREAFSTLSAPTKLSFYQEEELDLLKLLKRRHSKNFPSFLKSHQQKYFWLENSYFRTKVLKENFFLTRIKEKIKAKIDPDKAIKKIYDHLRITKEKKLKLLTKLKNKKEIKKISNGLSYCIWWQDQRKKYIFQYLHYLDLFLREFSRQSKISPRIFDFAWPQETCLNPSQKLINLLKKRSKDYFLVHFSRNKKRCIYGKRAKKIYQIFWTRKEAPLKNEFKGIVVYAGTKPIIGKVYVIKKVSDIKKFPLGRILITTMTAPEYITAIKKAKVIVTDEGGITCHAAIVSRELGIPCIVGTKIATKVLKDGDLVEVDASAGIVRKLPK